MEDASEYRRWDEMIPDALGLIFKNLPLNEILTVVPRVCKAWRRAVAGPYCWQEIDIEEWSNQCAFGIADRMVQMLVTRSGGSLRKLRVCNLGLVNDGIFSFIADNASSLQTLELPRSEMTNSILEQITPKLSTIAFLDISYCSKIGVSGLESIGRNCRMLMGLCRNMHPCDKLGLSPPDDEAHAIASTMPKLKHLEIAYQLVRTESVLEILHGCPELEHLDLRGCWDVRLDGNFLKESFPKLKVLGPMVVDDYGKDAWEDGSDLSENSEYLAWEFIAGEIGDYSDDDSDGMWDDECRLEDLEMRFYEGIEDVGLYGWPPSP